MKLTQPPTGVAPNILLYGPPKTGKTTGACSVSERTGLLNLDLPNASLAAHRRNPNLVEIEFTGFDTLVEVINELKSPQPSIDAIVVDPVGELHRRLLEELSNRAIRPSRDHYGDVSTHVERFCRALCQLPQTTVLVCHDWSLKDEATGVLERLPWTGTTNPSLGSKLMGMVDIVGYTGVVEQKDGGKEYVAQLVSQQGRRGGDRFGALGDWHSLELGEWMTLINPQPQEAVAA